MTSDRPSLPIDDLLAYIFEGRSPALADEVAGWAAASTRFQAFAEVYRAKIRKKIRGIRDDQSLRDLRFELEVAYLLLGERRFVVEYEKGGVGKQRGPDFCVTYKGHTSFNVEVKHIRLADQAPRGEEQAFAKLASVICQTIGQLPAGMVNLLVVGHEGALHDGFDPAAGMQRLRALAEQRDEPFFARRGFTGSRDFLRQHGRLSAALFRGLNGQDARPQHAFWLNPIARHQVPEELRGIFQRLAAPARD